MSRISTLASGACLALLLLAGVASQASAQSEAGGISTLFAPGPRADGMGRAFTAVANDANAIWWNPGGLAFLRGHDISLTYSQLVPDLATDVNWSYPVYAQHVEGWGGLAASVGYLSYGKSEATDVDGNVTGEFTSYEVVPAVAYGTELADNVGFGVALKLIRVDLAPQAVTLDQKNGRGTTFAADIGGLIKMPAAKVALGATLSNLGPDIAYIDQDQSDPLGRNIRVGVAYTPVETDVHRVLVAADASRFLIPGRVLAVDVWNAGAEYEFNRLIALRAGYISDPLGDITDFTFGLGLMYHGVRFDYASIPQSSFLNRVNRFALAYHF
jgi:hypothetical protein